MHENDIAFTSHYVSLPNGEQLEPVRSEQLVHQLILLHTALMSDIIISSSVIHHLVVVCSHKPKDASSKHEVGRWHCCQWKQSTYGGKLESSSTKIVQCPGPVKFSSFQPPERVFSVFERQVFSFRVVTGFHFWENRAPVRTSFVHLSWIAFLLVLLCERKREKACFAPFLCSCVLSCRFFSIWTCLLLDSVLRFNQNSPALLYSRALLVFRALLRALGF